MAVLSVRELNSNISKAIARVEAGETLDITKNGKVIAEIRPKGPVRDAAWWETYHRMVARMKEGGFPLGPDKITEEDKYGDADL